MPKFSLEILADISTHPGVYQMVNAQGKVIYVGKARNLKKRVASYFRSQLDTKTQAMIAQVVEINTTITRSDTEALLLEANLIKTLKPRYNVLLRDDKQYPFLHITTEQKFPRLSFYRGKIKKTGKSFGPYPNIGSVRENLALLQKLFKLRSCTDSFFQHRTRPCLQYQIKRCTAPCVDYVDEASYQEQVSDAMLFLTGKDEQVVVRLEQSMEKASTEQDYERAAVCRDQIVALRKLQNQQFVHRAQGDVDVLMVAKHGLLCAVSLLMVRQGRVLGNKIFYPKVAVPEQDDAILAAFISQYYFEKPASELPALILIQQDVEEKTVLSAALNEISIKLTQLEQLREPHKSWFKLTEANLTHALKIKLQANETIAHQYEALQTALNLPEPIQRMECFDISHTQGEATVASCVVFDELGAAKKLYRQYNIKDVTPGDDYAAMEQALRRRFTQLKEKNRSLPDILIVDGGKGQLTQAVTVLEELQCTDTLILGLAKGPERKAGMEKIFRATIAETVMVDLPHEAKLLLQRIRDEAHRFAITRHRKKRAKTRAKSPLESIPGIGAVRRKALLQHFGGWQQLKDASIEELSQVKGVNKALAEQIYASLHKS